MATGTTTPGFDQTTYTCNSGVTHHNADCTAEGTNLTKCTYDTRGGYACFQCSELPAFTSVFSAGENIDPPEGGGPAGRNTPAADEINRDCEPAPYDEMVEWLTGLPTKLMDTTCIDGPRLLAAESWLKAWTGDFEYLAEMQERYGKFGKLTPRQAKGVLNCWRAEAMREQRNKSEKRGKSTGTSLNDVPSGIYMTQAGHRYKVDNLIGDEKAGKWTDWVFVKQGSEYGFNQRLGRQVPGGTYEGKAPEAITEIASDPVAAMARYGQNTGTCGRCSRTLEDEASRELGVGPVCAKKMGL